MLVLLIHQHNKDNLLVRLFLLRLEVDCPTFILIGGVDWRSQELCSTCFLTLPWVGVELQFTYTVNITIIFLFSYIIK